MGEWCLFNIIFLWLVCRCGTVVFRVIRIFPACWNDDECFFVDQFENKASEMMLWINAAVEILCCAEISASAVYMPWGAKLFRSRFILEIWFFFNSIFSSGAHSYWAQRWMWIFVLQFMWFNIWWKHFTVFGLLVKRNSINAGIFRPTGICRKRCRVYASSINI